MPEQTVNRVLRAIRRRVRIRLILRAQAVGGAYFAVVFTLGTLADLGWLAAVFALLIAAPTAAGIARLWWPMPLSQAAALAEAHASADNLLVTEAELAERPRPVRAELRAAIARGADTHAQVVDVALVVPLTTAIVTATAVVIGCGLLLTFGRTALAPVPRADVAAAAVATDIRVLVTPPAYTRRPVEGFENPVQLTVVAGSDVRISSGERVLRSFRAMQSESLLLQPTEGAAPRFLSLTVVPDAPPMVRVPAPGRDRAFAQPRGTVDIMVESTDDIRLTSLALRYTKASGGGENVTFTEGEIPMTIERASDTRWAGRAVWALDGLDLADGDVLVYRAVARDANPSGEAVQSDAFVIEIGRTAEIASAGFALPTEEKKYAISQQMVIYKTEQLLKSRAAGASSLPSRSRGEDWLEQTRGLGVEQRMVRAEVVFLSGGEVEDEVEEAAHSHELAEGRLVNPGRAEMVRALNFMSRAEAQLNDGNAQEALVFERQALASLERALDRRRYFLRTLPDRSRIDVARRLTGDRTEAQSWPRPRAILDDSRVGGEHRALIRELAAAVAASNADAALAARVAAIDPNATRVQEAAVSLATAVTPAERRAAAERALQIVIAHALSGLPASTPVDLFTDPLAGRLADALSPRPQR